MSETQQERPEPKFSHSPSIGKIAMALSKAQRQFGPAMKDKTNPHYKSKYADMEAVLDVCREPLGANELALIQPPVTSASGAGRVCIITMLMHSSGEWMKSECDFPVGQQTAQAYGSAITYARRYCGQAMLGIAPGEDDDGNAASVAPAVQTQGKGMGALRTKVQARAATAPPPQEAEDAPPPEDAGPVVPFGKNQGTPLSALTDKQLTWYVERAEAKNEAEWLGQLNAEIERRQNI